MEGYLSILEKADAYNSWHPYTQMKDYLLSEPVHIEEAHGCWLLDANGNKYLDCHSSNWSTVHGHNDPDLNNAIIKQLSKLSHSSYKDLSHPSASELCRLLNEITPNVLTRSFFTDNGSCAIETAFKLSFQYWQINGFHEKQKCLCMENSYHGDTFGAMSASRSNFHNLFAKTAIQSLSFPAPYCVEQAGIIQEIQYNESLEKLEALLKAHHQEIAFLVLEPSIQGPGKMRFQPPGFLKAIASLCKKFNVHLILDEIFVGFYRTGGKGIFACEKEEVAPDFLCMGKGLTGGYLPLAATMTTEEIYQAYYDDYEKGKTFFHGHTFAANPLACAVTIENIKKLRNRIKSNEFSQNQKFFEEISLKTFVGHPYVKNVRQRGFVFAMDLEVSSEKKYLFGPERRLGHKISLLARKKGLMIRAFGNCIFLIPSFVMSRSEIELMCSKTSESICEFMEKYLEL